MELDYDQLTDEQLLALKQGKELSYDDLSDDQLKILSENKASSGEIPVIQEMHPDISTMDRLIVKNFGNDPGVWEREIKKRYPDLQVQRKDSQILVKKPSESQFRVLDPDTGALSSDILGDIGDVSFDTAAGLIEGSGRVLGGLGGSLAGPLGVLGGQAAAGGIASGAMESLRQAGGQALGLDQDFSLPDIAISTGLGGALPVAGSALKATGRGIKDLAIKGLDMASGVPEKAIKAYAKKPDFFDVEMAPIGKLSEYTEKVGSDIYSALKTKKDDISKQFADIFENTGGAVDLSDTKKPFQALMESAEKLVTERPTPDNLERLADAKSTFKNLFEPVSKEELKLLKDSGEISSKMLKEINQSQLAGKFNNVNVQTAMDLKDRLAGLADFLKQGKGSMVQTSRHSASKSVADKKASNAAADALFSVNKAIDNVTEGKSKEVRELWKQQKSIEDFLIPKFRTPEVAEKTLRNLGNATNQGTADRIAKVDKALGTNILDRAAEFEALKYFRKPSKLPISQQGVSGLARTAGGATLGGSLGALAGYQTGGGYTGATIGGIGGMGLGAAMFSPSMVKRYIKAGLKGQQYISPLLQSPSVNYGVALPAAKSSWQILRDEEENPNGVE